MAVFPFPQLAELREKYTYNITPFPTSVKSSGRLVLYLEMITYNTFFVRNIGVNIKREATFSFYHPRPTIEPHSSFFE